MFVRRGNNQRQQVISDYLASNQRLLRSRLDVKRDACTLSNGHGQGADTNDTITTDGRNVITDKTGYPETNNKYDNK